MTRKVRGSIGFSQEAKLARYPGAAVRRPEPAMGRWRKATTVKVS